MNIWLDLTNSPHVNFFAHMIRELSAEHHVHVTCRPLANTIELLDLHEIPYTVVGKHYGANKRLKLVGFVVRIVQLCRYLRRRNIDVAIAQSSYYAPLAARLCGIPSVYTNDNEHARGNAVAFPFASVAILPETLEPVARRRKWARRVRLRFYPGVKEGVYLWSLKPSVPDADSPHALPHVFVRPEPSTAHYYSGARDFMDATLRGLRDRCRISLLPRDTAQREHYRGEGFEHVVVVEHSLAIEDIMARCDLLIGAGGTMTREAAVLGIPTISVYQDKLLCVDEYLISEGAMIHRPELTADEVMAFLKDRKAAGPNKALLDKGHAAYKLILQTLLELGAGRDAA